VCGGVAEAMRQGVGEAPAAVAAGSAAADAVRVFAFIEGLTEPRSSGASGAPIAVPAAALAAAALDHQAAVICADAALAGVDLAEALTGDGDRRGGTAPVLIQAPSSGGSTILPLRAPARVAADWPLSPQVRQAMAGGARELIFAYRPLDDTALIARACESWRMTPLESRVVAALLAHETLRPAARAVGIAYETAREALAGAMAKAGARRQSDLVRRLHVALGVGEFDLAEVGLLSAALGLSERAAAVARLVALGLSRPEIAASLAISDHVVKAELKRLFELFGVGSAIALSEQVVEASVLLALAGSDNQATAARTDEMRPLRLINRPGGSGRIALSDYGPASGRPALLMHSALTGSLIDRGLVAALQGRGLRPIAIERPGFGLTDPPEDDPRGTAAQDMAAVVARLKLKPVVLICRGGEAAALDFAADYAEHFAGGVLINPFRPYDVDTRWDGLMNLTKRLIAGRPQMIEPLAALLVRRASPASLARVVREAVKDSPADLAVLEDPRILADYIASARLAALATPWGFIHEQQAYVGWRPRALTEGERWVRILGEEDVLYLPGEGDEVWERSLPGHRVIRRADAGRLIHASHPEVVAQACADLLD